MNQHCTGNLFNSFRGSKIYKIHAYLLNACLFKITLTAFLLAGLSSCGSKSPANTGNKEMVALLSDVYKNMSALKSPWAAEKRLAYFDSVLNNRTGKTDVMAASYEKTICLLQLGKEQEAITILEEMLSQLDSNDLNHAKMLHRDLAIAYMRLGERNNCIHNHSAASCIFPIQGDGIHTDKNGSQKAIEQFEWLLRSNPNDLESRWLLNIAFMTIGTYPNAVPAAYLIKGLDTDPSSYKIKPFTDIAINMGLNGKSQAGGNIVDDFNNDGCPDIITSSWDLKENMLYYRNNGDGSFTDMSDSSGLKAFTGGLNMMQTDYNNDGFKDIFILRGAWKGKYGKEPNSLLRNNGNGTFTDVTKQSGLLSFHPTQTATWNDFNNDGWLDVFIGNESRPGEEPHPCELYINNKNGTFTNAAIASNTNVIAFVKGVSSGDYNNDGWPDIFLSTLGGKKYLFRNDGINGGPVHFTDVTFEAGLGDFSARTFPTWFWDYDNDGWLDILVCGYEFDNTLATYAAEEALHMPTGNSGKVFLFKNKHDGSFENVSEKCGLDKIAFAMGSNFGDIDNDGYPDIFLGTGNPQYQSLVPNKMFRNMEGKGFADVTASARVGNLQKGHGVAFCDLDNDGDEDIYIKMGGAYKGDAYENSLLINPGQNNNGWINLNLTGVQSNKAAIGAKIKVTFAEKGVTRSVYRDVNSGGSFGSNPLTQHIGIGQATSIESVEIKWPATNTTQVFKNIKPGDYIQITEGNNSFTKRQLNKIDFTGRRAGVINCAPPGK